MHTLMLALSITPQVVSQAAIGPPSPDYLFAAFADNQQRVRSGIVRMKGTLTDRQQNENIQGNVEIFSAFDDEYKSFRFDRTEPIRLPPEVARVRPTTDGRQVGGGKYAEMPKRVVFWHVAGPKTVRLAPVGHPRKQVADEVFPFDPRILGLSNWITVRQDCPSGDLVSALRQRLAAQTADVSEPRPGLVRVRWTGRGPGLEIDFDRAVGHLPVRYADIRRAKADSPSQPHDTAITAWQARDGVYVPVTARFQDGPDDSPNLKRYDLKLTWEVVNGPVDESLFTARGLGLTAGTRIVDNSQSEGGVPLGKIGDLNPHPALTYRENNPVTAPQLPPPKPGWPWWVWPLATVATVIVVTAVVRLRLRS